MKLSILAATSALLFAASAHAGEPQPEFVPLSIDRSAYQAIMTYLGEVPAKYANPLIGALEQKEKEAVAAKAKADAEIKEPQKQE